MERKSVMGDAPELKPCPFCKCEAKVVPDRVGFGGYVGCMNLSGCLMPHRRYDKRKGPKAAIAAWNTRADLSDAMTARIAELEALNAELVDALATMVQEAKELADSGDAGFWDPEAVPSMIAARAVLAKQRPRNDT